MFKREHGLMLLVVIIAIGLRFIPIYPNYFSFMYDNAKDSLVMMQMGTALKPSLVGAVTSIPGVYYGPLWYYLALPLNIIMQYQPLASVLTVVLLSAITVALAWLYLGRLEAVWIAVSTGIIGTQTSAWSPYLTPLLMIPILILLKRLQTDKEQQVAWQVPLIFLLVSFSFHFQPAFAVVLLPLVLVILLFIVFSPSVNRGRVQFHQEFKSSVLRKAAVRSAVTFAVPFVPHLIFELRHQFHQTRQLLEFFTHYQQQAQVVQPNQTGLSRLLEVGGYLLDSAGQALSPVHGPYTIIGAFIVGLVTISSVLLIFKKRTVPASMHRVLVISIVLLGGTGILYLLLPVKSYYLVAVLPVWIVLVSHLVKQYIPHATPWIIGLLLLSAAGQANSSYQHYRSLAQTSSFLLQPKQDAIEKVYELSSGQPFISYQFVPEVYDYTYQLLYRQLIRRGYPEPIEYSYAPGEIAYMEQIVPELVPASNFVFSEHNFTATDSGQPFIFLIVEKPVYEWAYRQWWERVAKSLDILEQHHINAAITVYRAQAK